MRCLNVQSATRCSFAGSKSGTRPANERGGSRCAELSPASPLPGAKVHRAVPDRASRARFFLYKKNSLVQQSNSRFDSGLSPVLMLEATASFQGAEKNSGSRWARQISLPPPTHHLQCCRRPPRNRCVALALGCQKKQREFIFSACTTPFVA